MILGAILSVILGVIKAVMGVFTDLPPINPSISSAGDWITNTIASVIGFLQVIYSSPLLVAMFAIIIVLLAFEQIYHSVMWIVRKIPFLAIK